MRHPRLRQWETKLKRVLNQIDLELEETFANRFPLHPSRPAHGTTHNPMYSGLFRLGASFSPGFGSQHGRGYIVQLSIATLSRVPAGFRAEIEESVMEMLRQRLPQEFPGRVLRVERDKDAIKIIGDLSLGSV